jgi:hypothetical protein
MPIPAGPATGLTAADLIDETKRILLSGQREQYNKLAADTAPGATTLSFTYSLGNIQAGAYVQIGLEVFYVWEADPNTQTATVEPAQIGSLAATHDLGDFVTVNPKFPDHAILRALNEDLYSLSSPTNGLYAIRSADLAYVEGRSGYDMDGVTDLIDVLEIRTERSGSVGDWPLVGNFTVSRDVDATDFPSGYALFLTEPGVSGANLRVRYKATFGALSALTDDVELVTGLPPSAHDLPPLGAALRLAYPREIKRSFTESQGDTRRAAEVPAGSSLSSARGIAALRQTRINEEYGRLWQLFPARQYMPAATAGTVAAESDGWY